MFVSSRTQFYCWLAIFCALPSLLWANAGAPLIFISFPGMLIGLIPIILVETFIIKKIMGYETSNALYSTSVANVISTLIGIPLTVFVVVAINLVYFPLIGESMDIDDLIDFFINNILPEFLEFRVFAMFTLMPGFKNFIWINFTVLMVLLIPFFFISWKVEAYIIKKMNRNDSAKKINSACLKANLCSYALLYVVACFNFWVVVMYSVY